MKRTLGLLGILVCVSVGVFMFSCNAEKHLFTQKIDEGRIVYDVSYPELEDGHMMTSILPNEMTISFKGNRYNSEFNTYGGVFKSKICVDASTREYAQALKVFKKKLACDFDPVDIEEMLSDFPAFSIVPSGQVDTIAGIACKVAHGVFYDLTSSNIKIYYTDMIGVENPNWCSPFDELDGFLMAYDLDMFDMRLRLTAKDLSMQEVDEEEFGISDDYKQVSYKYIKTEIEKLMMSFDI